MEVPLKCRKCGSENVISRGKSVQCNECGSYTNKKYKYEKVKGVICPYCNSDQIMRRGKFPRQRYQCRDEKHPESKSRYFYRGTSLAKVLLFDIETLPMEFYGWRLWDKITSPDFIIRDWCVLSYSAKWLFQPSHMSKVLTPKQAIAHDDKDLVEEIWSLFNEADVIVAHNGQQFDLVRMNTRFILYDMIPPSPYQNVDTLKTAQKAFGFSSNKLDYLGQYLGVDGKNHTDFDLWKRCVKGDQNALNDMLSYNERDVYLLEDVYVLLRPWIQHPNIGLYVATDEETSVCPKCGSDDIDWGETYTTMAGVFNAFRCNNCSSIGRAVKRKRTVKSRSIA